MKNIPGYIDVIFILTTFITVFIFFLASNRSRATLYILTAWLALQSVIGLSGFYANTNTFPPRFFLLVFPPFIMIIILFSVHKGKRYVDGLDLKTLTLLHTIRLPVEIVLLLLSVNKVVPQLMTFDGINWDILSGISAPFVYYWGFVQKKLSPKIILYWNIICLVLLLNIVAVAVLSAPFPFQKLAFDQPNIAVFYFPFLWLPGCIVPIVLLSHLSAIRRLAMSINRYN